MLIFLLALIDDEGDRQKFTMIFNQYHIQMEKVAMRILSEQRDAEDAVQNAFMQVIKHFEKVTEIPCEELLFWLISITKNEALMIWRKNKKTVPLEDWNVFTSASDSDMDYKALVALFMRMPETYRAVLEMKLLLNYTDREIAQHLGITETAVSTRASRGRLLLQKLVRKEGFHI
ncbi:MULTISPECIES: RNA polymerase sigma factor [unclassified Sedimentibacter]|uniref:RNA polymerase sigma factor n=1 Tax=unclassified Sedimentibacter TaxID=2649220 RepID=UPI0027E0104F|nr:sigma-70 family RNA polymerase sigma factor [Sedimentibacter sp. MB35-C1]WMJ75951.1 sigma-70 family RNA polymerase sigma factor [Sedimentibacter sp. MB35-C1]